MKEKDVNNLKIVSDDENIKIIIDGKEMRFVNSLTLKIRPGKFRTAEATLYKLVRKEVRKVCQIKKY